MTPAQLRAYASVVRAGSVKDAAAELGLTEQAISMHMGQLRKSLGDPLFTRTGSGLAFTPGGLRLAGRAVEILGLQDQTVTEVGLAAEGRRTIRLGASNLFAEHAASGLIELFTKRAKDLKVELSVHQPDEFPALLASRAVDIAVGPAGAALGSSDLAVHEFLSYDIEVIAAPSHRLAGRRVSPEELTNADWYLGPSAAGTTGVVPRMLQRLRLPEDRQRIFQSDAAALEETKRGAGLNLALTFAVRKELQAGRLVKIDGANTAMRGTWSAVTVAHDPTATAAELKRFVSTPRAIQAMLQGAGVPVKSFRPAIYVTLWN